MNEITKTVIDLKTVSKENRETIVNELVGAFLEVDNPIALDVKLKFLEDTIKAIRTDVRVKNTMFDELDKYGGTYENAGITVKLSSRKTLDMSEDVVLSELKAKVKAREAYLKALKGDTVDEKTGEIIKAPIQKFTEYFSIKY